MGLCDISPVLGLCELSCQDPELSVEVVNTTVDSQFSCHENKDTTMLAVH